MKIKIKKDMYVDSIEDFLEALALKSHRERSFAARIIKRLIKNGEIAIDEWIDIVIEEIETIRPSLAEDLKNKYEAMKEMGARRTMISRGLKELAEDLRGQNEPNWFAVLTTAYMRVLKKFRKAGLVYRRGGVYRPSKRFCEVLRDMADFWERNVVDRAVKSRKEGGE